MKEGHTKKLIRMTVTKEDWKQYSLWGRFGIRVCQIIGLIEVNVIKPQPELPELEK